MTPTQSMQEKQSLIRRAVRGTGAFFAGIPGGLYGLVLLLFLITKRCWLETRYWFRLFLYTSRNFLRLEALLSIVGAVLFFGYVITYDLAVSGERLIYYSYIYFSVVMVMLSMNILPREKESGTLEILWSQPLSRRAMIILQLVTLSIWMFVLNLIWLGFIEYFTAYPEGKWVLLLLVWTTTIAVGALTLLISTLCRHAIATGLVALLILGLHFYWLQSLGPVQFYFIPNNLPQLIASTSSLSQGSGSGDMGARENFNRRNNFGERGGGFNRGRGSFNRGGPSFWTVWFDVIFNRVTVFVAVGFILDYLFRRLRRTSEWFT